MQLRQNSNSSSPSANPPLAPVHIKSSQSESVNPSQAKLIQSKPSQSNPIQSKSSQVKSSHKSSRVIRARPFDHGHLGVGGGTGLY